MDEYISAILMKSTTFGESPRNFHMRTRLPFEWTNMSIYDFPKVLLDKYFTPDNFYTNRSPLDMIFDTFRRGNIAATKLFIERFAGNHDLYFQYHYTENLYIYGCLCYNGKNNIYGGIKRDLFSKNFEFSWNDGMFKFCPK